MQESHHYQKAYKISDQERWAYFNKMETMRDDKVLFFISFYSSDRHFADLMNPKAHWDLRLRAGTSLYKPEKIEKIGRRADPLELSNYPYITPWSRGYYVWFSNEVQNQSRPWVLSVRSPSDHSELTWK